MVENTTVPPLFFLDLDWECLFYSNESDCEFFDSITANESNSTDEGYLKIPSYYSLNYQIVGTIFQSIILIVGVLGNTMVVIVVTRTRTMHTPTNCYLVSLAMADLMTLIATVPNEILAYYILGDEWIWGRIGCALFVFLGYLGINVSSLSITAFTFERYIAICHPMRAQIVCTVSRAKKIITGVWIFAFLYCSPWLFLTKIEPLRYKGIEDSVTCTFALTRKSYLGYFFLDLVLFYIIPLVLSSVLYGLIARVLFSRDIQRIQNEHTNGLHFNQDSKRNTNNSNARVQVVKMLVVVVAVFALLWLPYRLMVVYNSFARQRYMELWFLMFCKTMVFINSAINPILYNAMSVKFRRAFKKMLSCRRTDEKPPGHYMSVAGSVFRRHHHTVTSQVTSCTVEQLQQQLL